MEDAILQIAVHIGHVLGPQISSLGLLYCVHHFEDLFIGITLIECTQMSITQRFVCVQLMSVGTSCSWVAGRRPGNGAALTSCQCFCGPHGHACGSLSATLVSTMILLVALHASLVRLTSAAVGLLDAVLQWQPSLVNLNLAHILLS